MLKLKDKNEVLEQVVTFSLKELSILYSKETEQEYIFEFWHNMKAKDKDGNLCFHAVIDVRRMSVQQTESFKTLYDRMVIQRPNKGTVEKPVYGKQTNYEESRYTALKEILAKSVSGFALGLSLRTKEQIEDFNKIVEKELTKEEELELGYQYALTLKDNTKNEDGTYTVPEQDNIPKEFWGKVVTSQTIVWN